MFDGSAEHLFEVSLKLEQMEKKYNNAEGDVGALARRALLLEEEESTTVTKFKT